MKDNKFLQKIKPVYLDVLPSSTGQFICANSQVVGHHAPVLKKTHVLLSPCEFFCLLNNGVSDTVVASTLPHQVIYGYSYSGHIAFLCSNIVNGIRIVFVQYTPISPILTSFNLPFESYLIHNIYILNYMALYQKRPLCKNNNPAYRNSR